MIKISKVIGHSRCSWIQDLQDIFLTFKSTLPVWRNFPSLQFYTSHLEEFSQPSWTPTLNLATLLKLGTLTLVPCFLVDCLGNCSLSCLYIRGPTSPWDPVPDTLRNHSVLAFCFVSLLASLCRDMEPLLERLHWLRRSGLSTSRLTHTPVNPPYTTPTQYLQSFFLSRSLCTRIVGQLLQVFREPLPSPFLLLYESPFVHTVSACNRQ